ncbi:kinase-like domain-containing protein [Mycena metata]|uniref:Kinase-like domain-containing protein n=1 Tax=Mycena metata TaxID=1033252 RepID=A0AAD7NSB2_9AGAR|nr:kinase-like domain-containing protein [Mycena metata]
MNAEVGFVQISDVCVAQRANGQGASATWNAAERAPIRPTCKKIVNAATFLEDIDSQRCVDKRLRYITITGNTDGWSVEDSDLRVSGDAGIGRYSEVVPALDQATSEIVAVKIIRRTGEDRVEKEHFDREVRILRELMRLPPSSIARFCQIKDHFSTQDYFFIVFEKYGNNLETVLLNPRLSPFPLYQCKEISRQLVQATRLFVSNATTTQQFYGLDNVFRNRTILKSTEIRIVDFGSVLEDTSRSTGMIGTAGYRAPEVLLNWPWDKSIDQFALGCIIAEIITYNPLIQHNPLNAIEDIAIMDKVLGPFSSDMADRIRAEFPAALDYRTTSTEISDVTSQYLTTTKTILDRIEDKDAARLIKRLTELDSEHRGDLKTHEKCRFLTTYEM